LNSDWSKITSHSNDIIASPRCNVNRTKSTETKYTRSSVRNLSSISASGVIWKIQKRRHRFETMTGAATRDYLETPAIPPRTDSAIYEIRMKAITTVLNYSIVGMYCISTISRFRLKIPRKFAIETSSSKTTRYSTLCTYYVKWRALLSSVQILKVAWNKLEGCGGLRILAFIIISEHCRTSL
jgi:hypothetical protein